MSQTLIEVIYSNLRNWISVIYNNVHLFLFLLLNVCHDALSDSDLACLLAHLGKISTTHTFTDLGDVMQVHFWVDWRLLQASLEDALSTSLIRDWNLYQLVQSPRPH